MSVLREKPDTKNVVLRYRVNGAEVKDEEFDLVVLSVGLSSPAGNRQLAEKLSIKTNPHGFCESHSFSPIKTSRPGIYACGVFHAPMDIPDSVTMASGAASHASQLLSDQRGTLIEEKSYPPERDITGEPPRIGVFVCDCGTNIVKVVDVARVVRYAEGLGGVVHAEEDTFSCSIDSITRMVETIKEKGLNRVVVAACTPRTHEPVFQDALKQAGINPYAQDLVRMAVTKARILKPLSQVPYDITPAALVIGGGISGMVSALSLANQGFRVHLIERSGELGGMGRKILFTVEKGDVRSYVRELIQKVYKNLLIQVHTEADITGFSGYVGNFTTKIAVGSERVVKEIAHGVTIVATGAEEFRPDEYLYGQDPRVFTLLELETEIERDS
ncbi:MAG: FAD-dependent oxidoreductase, partial [Deltaproteobacteria bacterium]|nr:FAD-dependent oxidoreductase [Deltaproteobacteria bacterium]